VKHTHLLALGILAFASCSNVNPIPLGSDSLDSARVAAAAGQWEKCWDELRDLDSDDLDRSTLVEYHLMRGDAAYQTERYPTALRSYELFLRTRGPITESRHVEARVYELGSGMLAGKFRSVALFSNHWRGRAALLGLATWAPESPYSPDALAALGEDSFEKGDYDEAALDYKFLLEGYAGSEWSDLAAFRLGVCAAYAAQDAPTNRALIRAGRSQLAEYLSSFPSGQYRDEAQAALNDVIELEAGYYLGLADYYDRIDNPFAAARYLEQAADFAATEAGATAKDRLASRAAATQDEAAEGQ